LALRLRLAIDKFISHRPLFSVTDGGKFRRHMEKLSARIENWSVVDNLIFNGFRKLEPGQRLTGYLMGHTDLPNGIIYTSVIQSVDTANCLVETTNTIYRLGHVNEQYAQWASGSVRTTEDISIPSFVHDSRKPVVAYPPATTVPAFRQG
jgi:hypothetical protein